MEEEWEKGRTRGEERNQGKFNTCKPSPKGLMNGVLSDLQLQPGGGLVASAIELCPPQPLLTVGGIPWGAFADEAADVLDETIARSKAANAEREKNPASCVRRFGGVLGQLFADLAVDLVPGEKWRSQL